ncbi:MAG: ABC transporter permease, partial [Chloroflexota bacterium]
MTNQLRWRKAWYDLWRNKVRTLLLVLSLSVGIATVGAIINTRSILLANLDREYKFSQTADATIFVPSGFDERFIDTVRRMPLIAEADGIGRAALRIETGLNEFVNIDLYAISDFDEMRLNKIDFDRGVWPPPNRQILLERTSLPLLDDKDVGDTLTIKTATGKRRQIKIAGLVQDFTLMPSTAEGRAYGYITLDTLTWLEEPNNLTQLNFAVSGDTPDKAYIRRVATQVEHKIETTIGRPVDPAVVPDPGSYPVQDAFKAVIILLGSLGALSLFGGGFLMINVVNSLMIQQKRQMGMMKAIGAQAGQIVGLYLRLIFILSLLSLLVGLPAAIWGGYQLSKGLGYAFNVDLVDWTIPWETMLLEVSIGVFVPFLAAIYPIMSGVRVTVREAINDYGVVPSTNAAGIDRFADRLRGFPRPMMLSIRNTFRRKGRMILTLCALTLSGTIFI